MISKNYYFFVFLNFFSYLVALPVFFNLYSECVVFDKIFDIAFENQLNSESLKNDNFFKISIVTNYKLKDGTVVPESNTKDFIGPQLFDPSDFRHNVVKKTKWGRLYGIPQFRMDYAEFTIDLDEVPKWCRGSNETDETIKADMAEALSSIQFRKYEDPFWKLTNAELNSETFEWVREKKKLALLNQSTWDDQKYNKPLMPLQCSFDRPFNEAEKKIYYDAWWTMRVYEKLRDSIAFYKDWQNRYLKVLKMRDEREEIFRIMRLTLTSVLSFGYISFFLYKFYNHYSKKYFFERKWKRKAKLANKMLENYRRIFKKKPSDLTIKLSLECSIEIERYLKELDITNLKTKEDWLSLAKILTNFYLYCDENYIESFRKSIDEDGFAAPFDTHLRDLIMATSEMPQRHEAVKNNLTTLKIARFFSFIKEKKFSEIDLKK